MSSIVGVAGDLSRPGTLTAVPAGSDHPDHSHHGPPDLTSAEDWDATYGADDHGPAADPFVMAEVAALDRGRALDLGCGSGGNAVQLASDEWSVTGVDWSPKAIELAERRASEACVDVELVVGDLTTWEANEPFDLVLSSYALPTGTQREALATAVAALAPGGTLLVLELDPEMVAGWGAVDDQAITPEAIAAELGDLEVERAEVVAIDRGADYDPKGHDHGKSVVVRAVRPS